MQKIYLSMVLIAFLFGGINDGASAGEKGSKAKEPAELLTRQTGTGAAKKIVAAKVNGSEISMHAVVQMMNRIASKSPAQSKNTEDEVRAVKQKALDRLILQELAYQKAQREGVQAPPENIDTALANFKENVGGEEGFRQFLEKEQLTEKELREQVTRSLTLEQMYAREVYRKVTIPEEDLKREYEKEKRRFMTGEKISVIDMVFPAKDISPELRKNAEGIRTRIMQDKNRDLWQIPLDGTFQVRVYEPRREKDRELREAAKKMKTDEVSPVLKASDGLHIIKLREYSPERQLPFEEVKAYLENRLRVSAQDKRLSQWEQELRKNAKIEIMNQGESK